MLALKAFLLVACLVGCHATYNDIDVTDDEIKSLTEQLGAADSSIASYITVNLQAKTTSTDTDDVASEPLLTVDSAVWDLPVVSTYKSLLNEYVASVFVDEEDVSDEKDALEDAFIAGVLDTEVGQLVQNFLISKGYITSATQYEKLLKHVWFTPFKRSSTAAIGSFGFEHMFRFEVRDDDLLGLHNALFFHIAESELGLNYEGYENYKDLGDGRGAISVRFEWDNEGVTKSEDSFFVGLSPELEFSLYTLCLITRPNRGCKTYLNGSTKVTIVAYSEEYNGSYYLGSAYPSI